MDESAPSQAPVVEGGLRGLDKRELALALFMSALRLCAGMAFVVLVMYLVPDQPGGSALVPVVVGIGGIVVYVLFFRRQLKRVYRAKYPTLQAAEALFLVAAMFLAVFSMIYMMTSVAEPESFTESLDKFTAYYFALTVLATVGFGDITPVGTFARSVTMVQMALDLVFIAVLVRVMTGAAKQALSRRKHQD